MEGKDGTASPHGSTAAASTYGSRATTSVEDEERESTAVGEGSGWPPPRGRPSGYPRRQGE